jgi:hypothetical protein
MSEQNPSTTSTTAQFISGSGPAAKLVNAFLRAEDIRDPKNPEKVKQIPDQMMYNYTKAKLRAGEKPLVASFLDENDKVQIERADLERWVKQYVGKLRGATAVHEPLVIELDEPAAQVDEPTDEDLQAEEAEELAEVE